MNLDALPRRPDAIYKRVMKNRAKFLSRPPLPPSEDEIMINWQGHHEQPVVTIFCATFNQASYIEDTLNGFLNQRTSFPFEILVHDDFSTDGTQDIINRFKESYPRIVRPILQAENQYSKGKKPISAVLPHTRGEFVAYCEGDDYWISFAKLEEQVKAMRLYPNVNISFHPVYKLTSKGSKRRQKLADYGPTRKIFTLENVILGSGGFIPTPSIMVKTHLLKSLPRWYFSQAPVGDYYLQIFAAISAGALYMPEVRSVYRFQAPGSWTSRRPKQTEDALKGEALAHELCLEQLIDFGVSRAWINRAVSNELCELASTAFKSGRLNVAKALISRSNQFYPNLNIKQKMVYFFRAAMPFWYLLHRLGFIEPGAKILKLLMVKKSWKPS